MRPKRIFLNCTHCGSRERHPAAKDAKVTRRAQKRSKLIFGFFARFASPSRPSRPVSPNFDSTQQKVMKKKRLALSLLALACAATQAQETKVAVAISGWTGFAPLTLAKEAGIFKKHGLDVSIKKIPQKDRHLAIASGDVQCAATTVETWVAWNANGVATTQIFQLDKSYGADGMVVKPSIAKITDLKGKTVAASAPGTSPYFALAWMLKKNGMSTKDVTVANMEPAAAAQAFVAGQNDAAMTYEPYLSTVRAAP